MTAGPALAAALGGAGPVQVDLAELLLWGGVGTGCGRAGLHATLQPAREAGAGQGSHSEERGGAGQTGERWHGLFLHTGERDPKGGGVAGWFRGPDQLRASYCLVREAQRAGRADLAPGAAWREAPVGPRLGRPYLPSGHSALGRQPGRLSPSAAHAPPGAPGTLLRLAPPQGKNKASQPRDEGQAPERPAAAPPSPTWRVHYQAEPRGSGDASKSRGRAPSRRGPCTCSARNTCRQGARGGGEPAPPGGQGVMIKAVMLRWGSPGGGAPCAPGCSSTPSRWGGAWDGIGGSHGPGEHLLLSISLIPALSLLFSILGKFSLYDFFFFFLKHSLKKTLKDTGNAGVRTGGTCRRRAAK